MDTSAWVTAIVAALAGLVAGAWVTAMIAWLPRTEPGRRCRHGAALAAGPDSGPVT